MTATVAVVAVAVLVWSAALLLLGMARHRRTVRAPASHRWPSVIALQRAGSGPVMGTLLDRLGRAGRDAIRKAIRVDGRMIVPGYAVFLTVLCLVSIAAVRHASSGGIEATGVAAALLAAVLALAAGCLDLVENRALVHVLDAWQDIPVPEKPTEVEAAQRQELRRQLVAAIEKPSRTAATVSAWKLRLLGLVLAWLLAAGVIAVAQAHG